MKTYDELKLVFEAFHLGLVDKLAVAFAIGLWQLSNPPRDAPLIDNTLEFKCKMATLNSLDLLKE